MHHIKYLRDNYRPNDKYEKVDGIYVPRISPQRRQRKSGYNIP